MTIPQTPHSGHHVHPAAHPYAYPPAGQVPPASAPPPIPPQWTPPPNGPGGPPAPPRRSNGLGLAALITAAVGLLIGLFGTPLGLLVGLVAIGLAIAGIVRNAGRVLAVIGLVVGVLALVVSIAVGLAPDAATPTAPATPAASGAPATPSAPVVQAPATVAPTPPAPATAITAREWQKIAKDPGAHSGESIVVYGTVTQFDSATGTDSFRANVDGVRHQNEYDYDTNTYLTGEASALSDLVDGDMFRAEVVVGSPYTYTTTMGGQMTVPTLIVTKVAPTT